MKATKQELAQLTKAIARQVLRRLAEAKDTSPTSLTDIQECYSKLGCNLTEDETDFLYRLNSDVKAINPQATVFPDKESTPGVCCFVVDCEPMLLYFRIYRSGGDCYQVEQITMTEAFKNADARADKKFSEHIESIGTIRDLPYDSVLELLSQWIAIKPLQERFNRMKAVLNG